jgi:UDP-glucose 4-epimerase
MQAQQSHSAVRVLLTGATGFVGRTLVSTLTSAIQWRAAVRSRPAAGLAADQIAVGSIDGQTDWSDALSGIDCVVHLAARVHVMNPTANDRTAFERTNVLGTERLARAAAAAGVRRFIYLSSIKVNGESTQNRAFRADDMPAPQDDYARSKLAAEQCLSAVAATSGMAASIIRPPLIYGPGVRANFLRLLSLAHSGLPIPLASIVNSRSMVSVWNLCDLICALLRHDQPMGGVFLVADGEGISTAELVRRLARIMGRPARLFAMPVGALRAAAALTGRSAELNRLCSSLVVDMSQTRSRLDWSPPVSLDDGLARTVRWYMQGRKERSAA